jgi:hypothetical protein
LGGASAPAKRRDNISITVSSGQKQKNLFLLDIQSWFWYNFVEGIRKPDTAVRLFPSEAGIAVNLHNIPKDGDLCLFANTAAS